MLQHQQKQSVVSRTLPQHPVQAHAGATRATVVAASSTWSAQLERHDTPAFAPQTAPRQPVLPPQLPSQPAQLPVREPPSQQSLQQQQGEPASCCSHGAVLTQCQHREQHLVEINARLVDVLLEAQTCPSGPVKARLDAEQKRLLADKQALEKAARQPFSLPDAPFTPPAHQLTFCPPSNCSRPGPPGSIQDSQSAARPLLQSRFAEQPEPPSSSYGFQGNGMHVPSAAAAERSFSVLDRGHSMQPSSSSAWHRGPPEASMDNGSGSFAPDPSLRQVAMLSTPLWPPPLA